MKKKKKAKAVKRKIKIQASVNKSADIVFDYSGYTLISLATELKINEEVLKQHVEKGTGNPYSGSLVITDEIWLSIKDFILNKIELTQRHIRIANSKKIKTGFKSRSKKKKKKMGGGKPTPYFIFGNLYKTISTPMGT